MTITIQIESNFLSIRAFPWEALYPYYNVLLFSAFLPHFSSCLWLHVRGLRPWSWVLFYSLLLYFLSNTSFILIALSTTYVLIHPKFMLPVQIVSLSTNCPHHVLSLNIFALVLQLGSPASCPFHHKWSFLSSNCFTQNPKVSLHFFNLHILSIIDLLSINIFSIY